ncbi:MAG TPA: glycosyltransferase family 10 [Saprospiraceae bacterium]|nr:glycosyltransferase family 10 [Saprospiraceae bacterium]
MTFKEKIVNVYFPYDESIWYNLFPKKKPIWNQYRFVLNKEEEKCDFCLIFTKYNLKQYTVFCPPNNVIFIPCEPVSIHKYTHFFLRQFGNVIGHRAQTLNSNGRNTLDPLPWFLKKSYDELMDIEVEKTQTLSVITSTKVMNKGHEDRLKFCYKLKEELGDQIDLYGRGINDFEDKWDVVTPYRYSIAIENSVYDTYITEKIFDCTLAMTYPIYYGASNVSDYLKATTRINILDYENALRIISKLIHNPHHYSENINQIKQDRQNYLSKYSPIPNIVSILDTMHTNSKSQKVTIKHSYLDKLYRRIYQFKL